LVCRPFASLIYLPLHQLLIDCGDYASQQSLQSFQVFEKGVDDYVTTVDQLLDQKLLAGMQALFPDDGIITEENKATAKQFGQYTPSTSILNQPSSPLVCGPH
jgi:3'(2'), 5'-bisphosphate nucleotidase